MKRPRFRGRWPWLGLLLAPALAWAAILALVPTGWAKARLVDRLARATGRAVGIGSVRLCVLGNLRVTDLTIAEPRTPGDPWLRVAEARMDVHLGQVLLGHCEPGEVEIDGLSARIWRRKDGTPEFGDLLRSPATPPAQGAGPTAAAAAAARSSTPGPIRFRVRGANLRVVDDPSGTRFDLTGVEGRATWLGRSATLDECRGHLNGGDVALAARLDRDPARPRFEVEAQAVGVGLGRGLDAVGIWVPAAAGAAESVGGKLSFRVGLKAEGATRPEIRRTLRGQGSIALDPIDLDGSRFLAALNSLGEWPSDNRVGSVTSDFAIERGRFTSDDLTIRVSRFPFVLAGWTDFDGRFDYSARGDAIAGQLPREAQAWLAELKVGVDQIAGLRFRGDPGHVEATIRGRPLSGDPALPVGERARLREGARRIRDRFFR